MNDDFEFPECAALRPLVCQYVYAELEGSERAAVERHLAACPACSAAVAQLDGVRAALTSWQVPPDPCSPESVARAVLGSERSACALPSPEFAPLRRRPRVLQRLAACAAALACVWAVAATFAAFRAQRDALRDLEARQSSLERELAAERAAGSTVRAGVEEFVGGLVAESERELARTVGAELAAQRLELAQLLAEINRAFAIDTELTRRSIGQLADYIVLNER